MVALCWVDSAYQPLAHKGAITMLHDILGRLAWRFVSTYYQWHRGVAR